MSAKLKTCIFINGQVTVRNQKNNLFFLGELKTIDITNLCLKIVFFWLIKNADGVEVFFNNWITEKTLTYEFRLLDDNSIKIEKIAKEVKANFICEDDYEIEIMSLQKHSEFFNHWKNKLASSFV